MQLLHDLTASAMNPALALLPARMDTPAARVLLLAICLQESAGTHRYQVLNLGGKGPARGLLQFEQGGGVRGVYKHAASRDLVREVCAARGVPHDIPTIWRTLETDDVLAFALGRLLMWTDAGPLPKLGDEQGGWELYAHRVWRPGALARQPQELRAKWKRNYAAAMAAVAA